MPDSFQILRGSSIRLSSRRVCSSGPTSSQYLNKMIPESTIARLDGRAPAQEPGRLLLGAEAHHRLDPGPVVPAAVEDHDLAGGREVAHVPLDVHLRLLPLGRRRQRDHPEHPRAHPLGDPPDRAALAGRVPALEHDADLGARRLHPLLHRHQLAVQEPHLLLVRLPLHLRLRRGRVSLRRVRRRTVEGSASAGASDLAALFVFLVFLAFLPIPLIPLQRSLRRSVSRPPRSRLHPVVDIDVVSTPQPGCGRHAGGGTTSAWEKLPALRTATPRPLLLRDDVSDTTSEDRAAVGHGSNDCCPIPLSEVALLVIGVQRWHGRREQGPPDRVRSAHGLGRGCWPRGDGDLDGGRPAEGARLRHRLLPGRAGRGRRGADRGVAEQQTVRLRRRRRWHPQSGTVPGALRADHQPHSRSRTFEPRSPSTRPARTASRRCSAGYRPVAGRVS